MNRAGDKQNVSVSTLAELPNLIIHPFQRNVPLPHEKRLTARACVMLTAGYLMAIALVLMGWTAWTEGSALIYQRHAASYIATRGGANEGAFYRYVYDFLGFGVFLFLANAIVTWFMFFTGDAARQSVVRESMDTPIGAGGGRIPTWLFWAVVVLFIGLLARAAVQ